MSPRKIAVAVAALVAAALATGFVRTKDQGTGVELFWPTPFVTYRVNAALPGTSQSCAPMASADPLIDLVRRSFSAWEQSCTNLRLAYGGPTTEIATGMGGAVDQNVVVFRRGWCSQHDQAKKDACMGNDDVDCGSIYNCYEDGCAADATSCADWNTLALTSVLYKQSTGEIVDADIEVNDWDGLDAGVAFGSSPRHGWYFTCADGGNICSSYGQGDCRYMDLQSTVTHEAGHVIGLGHSLVQTATMYATARPGDTEMRSLSSDDIAGVCAIYPDAGVARDGDDGDDGCGCSSTGPAGLVPLLVLGLALRRRRLTRR